MAGTYQSRGKQSEKGMFLRWFSIYTALFLGLTFFVWQPFAKESRSMIWGYDGLYQTYATMVYYSNYWKEVLKNLFSGHPSLPMVDASVGLGFDVFTSLNHYGFGDPLEIVSLFFSKENMEICYGILVVLRYYLSGLSFGIYCLWMGKREIPVLAGAFSYAFCGYALYAGVRHPYFINSMIYLPLMCLCAEQVLRKKRGYLLSVMTGIAACSNFYFLYMLTILTLLYAVTRFVVLYQENWKENLLNRFLAGCGWYLLGIGLGAVFLLPNILAFFGNARGGIVSGFANTWFAYPSEFYWEMLKGYLFPEYSARYWCVLGYPPMVLLGILLLLRRKKKTQEASWLGAWLLILSLILWVPLGGYVMNGFSYVSHRWIYGYSFCMALIVVFSIERMETSVRVERVLYAVVLLIGCLLYQAQQKNLKEMPGLLAAFGISAVVLFLLPTEGKTLPKGRRALFQSMMLGCVIASAASSSHALYGREGEFYTSEFQPSGTAWENMSQPAEVQMKAEMAGSRFYRVEGDTITHSNYGMLHQINGTNPFFSIVSNDVYSYMKAMENPDAKFPNWYNGMGDRAAMMSAASVRYFAVKAGSSMDVPFGYEKVEENGAGVLYESPYAMPLGYTYSAIIDEETWNALPTIRKQQALMQAAAVESAEDGIESSQGIKRGGRDALLYEETLLAHTVSSIENITWNTKTGEFTVGEGGGTLVLEFEGEENAETYVRVCGFDTDGSGQELIYFFVGNGESEAKKIYAASDISVWDGEFKDYLVAVGNGSRVCRKAELRFPFAGNFHLKDLEVYSLPMASYASQAEKRKQESLDTELEGNRIEGSISVSEDKFLCISLPYSAGWSAKVDGETVPVKRCNGMFFGVFLEKGNHTVAFSYQTPGIAAGAGISLLSLLVLAGFWIWQVQGEKSREISGEKPAGRGVSRGRAKTAEGRQQRETKDESSDRAYSRSENRGYESHKYENYRSENHKNKNYKNENYKYETHKYETRKSDRSGDGGFGNDEKKRGRSRGRGSDRK